MTIERKVLTIMKNETISEMHARLHNETNQLFQNILENEHEKDMAAIFRREEESAKRIAENKQQDIEQIRRLFPNLTNDEIEKMMS